MQNSGAASPVARIGRTVSKSERGACRGDTLRQRGDGRRLEQAADRDLDVERRADAADQPGGQQRVAAELEEVVVDADLGNAQHLGEQRAQHRFLRRARRRGAPRSPYPGAGSARRSSLPFGVSGSRSSSTNADGTM